MSIIKKLWENGVHRYYGQEDLSTPHLVKHLLNNKKEIINYFSNQQYTEYDINIYYEYVWVNNIKEITEIANYVEKSKQEDFIEIVNSFQNVQYDEEKIKIFIKENYIAIFNIPEDNHNLFLYTVRDFTFEKIYKTYAFFPLEIFRFIEKNYSHIILHNIEKCTKYYDKNQDDFLKIFEMPKNSKLFDVNQFIDTYRYLDKLSYKCIKKLLIEKTKEIFATAKELLDAIDEDNCIEYYYKIKGILSIVKQKKHSFTSANELEKIDQKLEEVLEKYLKKHGKKQEVDLSFVTKDFENLKNGLNSPNSFNHYFSITHIINVKNNKISSMFKEVFADKPALTDILAFTFYTDDYFLPSYVFKLRLFLSCKTYLIFRLILDNETSNFIFKKICHILKNIEENECEGNAELVESFTGMFNSLKTAITTEAKENTQKYNVVTTSMFLIGLIEKILRIAVLKKMEDEKVYIPKRPTLGEILRTRNNNGTDFKDNQLLEIFDIETIRSLEYLLIKTNNSNIGDNIRNNLMHNSDYKFCDMTNGFISQIFFLFLCVINGIYLNYLKTK
ncbi:MAG TPA: hypothetical protein PK626_04480 [Bacteroidales bacterium]|nr:hypothetical protein [Bacilli bacterium]HPX45621.1 hypothetical protein [Bacteroidales bacterium]HQA85841.1 hypothetical protein [Erysipelotrichaceae bacterium]